MVLGKVALLLPESLVVTHPQGRSVRILFRESFLYLHSMIGSKEEQLGNGMEKGGLLEPTRLVTFSGVCVGQSMRETHGAYTKKPSTGSAFKREWLRES